MKKTIVLLTLVLFLASSILSAQLANGKGERSKDKKELRAELKKNHPREKMKMILQLTDEQQARISDIRFKFDNLVLDTKLKVKKNKLIIRKMLNDKNVDQDKIIKITEENIELNGKIKLARTKMWLEVYNILDDTQKEQWVQTFEKGKNNQNIMDRFNRN